MKSLFAVAAASLFAVACGSQHQPIADVKEADAAASASLECEGDYSYTGGWHLSLKALPNDAAEIRISRSAGPDGDGEVVDETVLKGKKAAAVNGKDVYKFSEYSVTIETAVSGEGKRVGELVIAGEDSKEALTCVAAP